MSRCAYRIDTLFFPIFSGASEASWENRVGEIENASNVNDVHAAVWENASLASEVSWKKKASWASQASSKRKAVAASLFREN